MNTRTNIGIHQIRKQAYILRFMLPIIILLVTFCSTFAYALVIEDIQILKIAPKDERAIIKMPDGETRIIKVRDLIGGNILVTEISKGRVIFEEKTKTGVDRVIIDLDAGSGGKEKQKVIRIKKSPDKQDMLYKAK